MREACYVRLQPSTLARIEVIREQINAELKGLPVERVTRSEVLRMLIERGMVAYQAAGDETR